MVLYLMIISDIENKVDPKSKNPYVKYKNLRNFNSMFIKNFGF